MALDYHDSRYHTRLFHGASVTPEILHDLDVSTGNDAALWQPTAEQIGQRVRRARLARGMVQKQIAPFLGMQQGHYSQKERATKSRETERPRCFTAPEVAVLARVLGVRSDWPLHVTDELPECVQTAEAHRPPRPAVNP